MIAHTENHGIAESDRTPTKAAACPVKHARVLSMQPGTRPRVQDDAVLTSFNCDQGWRHTAAPRRQRRTYREGRPVILDVLHYIIHEAQEDVLRRGRQAFFKADINTAGGGSIAGILSTFLDTSYRS